MSRKVDRYLQFPFLLDMAPYLSSSILRSRFGNRLFPLDGEEAEEAPSEVSSEFELFAVITHSGKLDAGHYVTYLRLRNKWYKCDDAWITQVNDNIVRAAQGYMIFYVQKMLYYRASERQAGSWAVLCWKILFQKMKKKKKKEAGFGISRGGQTAFSFFSHTAISMANFFNIAMDHYFSLNLFLPFF